MCAEGTSAPRVVSLNRWIGRGGGRGGGTALVDSFTLSLVLSFSRRRSLYFSSIIGRYGDHELWHSAPEQPRSSQGEPKAHSAARFPVHFDWTTQWSLRFVVCVGVVVCVVVVVVGVVGHASDGGIAGVAVVAGVLFRFRFRVRTTEVVSPVGDAGGLHV